MNQENSALERESKTVEYKREFTTSYTNLIKTCIAFANTAGGKIVVGVEDKTLSVAGVPEKDQIHALESFSAAVYQCVSPAILPEVYTQRMGDKELVVIEISRGSSPPYFLKAQGIKTGVYVRVGPTTRLATEEHVEELLASRNRILFDSQDSQETIEALDIGLLTEAYGKSPGQQLLLTEKVLAKDIKDKPRATNAAILAFGKNPQTSIAECGFICTRFKGTEGRQIVETQEIDGPISEQISRALYFLKKYLERDFQLIEGRLKGRTLIPISALREAIVNAAIHRKYMTTSRSKVAIYDNRVEIFSSGSLPGLITISNLGDGSSHLRNPLLAKFARRLGLAEKLGSGVREMIDSCTKANIVPPEFSEDGDYVKVIFYIQPIKKTSLDLRELVQSLIEEQDTIRIRDISPKTNASRNTITNLMNSLVKERTIQRFGKGAGVYYKKSARSKG
jgi:ATP-dependent DNA helicase RecG